MYSTLKNVVRQRPGLNEASVAGRFLTYPEGHQKRVAEGGLRVAGKFKKRASADGIPLVTIITVCLNSAATLEQCLQSVFQQSYENVEYLVIDGGSADGTLELMTKYEHALDYYLSEPDGGLYQAMNKGLALATGDYILILNSDDWYAPDCIEALVKAKKYSGASFVSALAQAVNGAGEPLEIMRRMPYDESVRLRMPLRHETMLLSAELYNAVGEYDERYRIGADFDYTVRLYQAGHTLYELQRPLLFFRNNGVSHSKQQVLFDERVAVLLGQFPFLEDHEARLLASRDEHTLQQLLELSRRYPHQEKLVTAVRLYAEDNLRHSRRPQWRKSRDARTSWPVATTAQPKPLISIILPVFNAQDTLRECIDSVLAQTLESFELICINDATPDDSQKIIEGYQSHDPRVVSLVNDRNIGLGATRNKGVRHARGSYIFHIDPDDTIPPRALETLYAQAVRHGSDMVKGAYLREQLLFGEPPKKAERKSLIHGGAPIVNTSLADMPELLRTTEGHWSFLYEAELARRIPYPTDLKMGQDSLFLASVLPAAKRITIIDDVVYHYRANPASAMNTFNFRKFKDVLEWRRRAWHVLDDAGFRAIGNRLLQSYWGDAFFSNLASHASREELSEFLDKFRFVFSETGIPPIGEHSTEFLKTLFPLIIERRDEDARRLMLSRDFGGAGMPTAACATREAAPPLKVESLAPQARLRVATFCSMDHGGAGTGSQRRVAALRKHGIDARLFSLVVKSAHDHVQRITPDLPLIDNSQQTEVWQVVTERAISRARKTPGYCAGELFSLADAVLDFRTLGGIFDAHDVIHLHWVVGMLDYENLGDVLGNKPIVWTLADMNPFTGGCHYSEGCEEYKRECRRCPLLGGESDLAHETWKIKKRAYKKLENLHIVCPSGWMAERVRESSLLGDKTIHYIPNALPVDKLALTAKTVARIRLGLPLNKKLLLFGSERLANLRKGGDLLKAALRHFCSKRPRQGVELVVFGSGSIDTPLPVHRLGYVYDLKRLALMYAAADAYLFPCREDNAPLTVAEALLCGTPVVAFPVGNVRALIEHRVTGYIANHLDTRDFADGIEWVLSASAVDALARSARCRLHASAVHDPGLSSERHEAVYRLAMNGTVEIPSTCPR